MFKLVSDLKYSIAGLLTGTNLNNVTDLNGCLERAVRVMATQIDIPESSDRQTYMLYNGVYDYLAPTSIFGGAINDLRPQGISRTPMDIVYKQNIELFDTTKTTLRNGYQVTFEYQKGTPIMRVAQVKAPPKAMIDPMTATTGWVASGNASGLAQDQTVYYQSPASLRFNLAVAGSQGLLTKTLIATDLSKTIGTGVIFLAIYTPDVTDLTSLTVKLGSDASNYILITATAAFLGAFQANNWQLVAFDTAGMTTTGSPDLTKIAYAQIAVNYNGTAINNFRIGSFFISLPSPHELLFQTAAVFMNSSGVLSNTITLDTDQIILNDAAYVLLELEGSNQVCFQMGGTLASGAMQTINTKLYGTRTRTGLVVQLGLYDMYKADNPSQEIRMSGTWYP